MSPISAIVRCMNFFYFSSKDKKYTCKKVEVLAALFFIGVLYYSLKVIYKCYKKFIVRGEVHSTIKRSLVKDSVSEGLAAFNRSDINGKVYGIYITTNETNLEKTEQFLSTHPRPSAKIQTIHIGCATWYNLDIMCKRISSYGLIIDFNPANAEFIQTTIDTINISASREIFKQKIIIYLNSLNGEQRKLFFHQDQQGSLIERIEQELLRKGSWLQTEENYLFIKTLIADNRLIAITENIENFQNFSSIRHFLDLHHIVIDTLYLSNICNFMSTARSKNSFVKSIKQMLNKDTILINCPKLKYLDNDQVKILHQKSMLGKEVLAHSYDTRKLFEEVI